MKKILIINLILVLLISCGNVNKKNAQVQNDTNISATDESSPIDALYSEEMEEKGLLLPFNYLNYLEYEHSDYLTDMQGDDWDGKNDPRFINEDGTFKNDTICRYYTGWNSLPSSDNDRKILRITYEESTKGIWNYALLKTDKKQFNVYMLTVNKTVKLITVNNKPIDSLIVDNNHRYRDTVDYGDPWNYNWREKTFTIFPNLEIVFYQNKFNGDQMIEHIPTAKYRIDDNGKFVKFEE